MVAKLGNGRIWHKGFTLIELLVVIGVIGILAAVTIYVYTGSQTRARDTKRKSDLHAVQIALQQYYTDKGTYPTTFGDSIDNQNSWVNGLVTDGYIKNLPNDPINGTNNGNQYDYQYSPQCVANGVAADYVIFTRLENQLDLQILKSPGLPLNCGGYWTGGISNYDYAIGAL